MRHCTPQFLHHHGTEMTQYNQYGILFFAILQHAHLDTTICKEKDTRKLHADTCTIQRDSVYEIWLPTAGVGDKDF
jgi:hypothetical protein